jgi:DNA repair photolyase
MSWADFSILRQPYARAVTAGLDSRRIKGEYWQVLFPELAPSGLIGIAKLAAGSEVIESKRRVEYLDLATRSFFSRPSGRRMPFDWQINPYRGCEFGCKYCYARYTHEFMELRETWQFEQKIFVKKLDEARFRGELTRIRLDEAIAIGTATDPYQPAERRYGQTRRILEIFAGERGRTLSVTTKSDLISRDTELLSRLAKQNIVHVLMTVTTTDENLARAVEPYAPRPGLRLDAVRSLTTAGVRVLILANPVMPLITDSEQNLTSVAMAAKEAGATYMMGGVLFLKPCAQKAFFPFLEQQFPQLVRKYRERYGKGAWIRGPYEEMIAKRVSDIRRRFGLTQKPDRYEPDLWAGEPQLTLFPESSKAMSSPSTAAAPPHSMPEQYSPSARKVLRHQKSR